MPNLETLRKGKPMKVLVVDDDKEVRDLVVASLRELKNSPCIETADSGLNVEQKVNRIRPSLVILDLKLPGMHGMKICEKIKKSRHGKKIKILVLTAYLTPGARETVMECGADYCMEKPFGVLELAGVVEKLLAGGGT